MGTAPSSFFGRSSPQSSQEPQTEPLPQNASPGQFMPDHRCILSKLLGTHGHLGTAIRRAIRTSAAELRCFSEVLERPSKIGTQNTVNGRIAVARGRVEIILANGPVGKLTRQLGLRILPVKLLARELAAGGVPFIQMGLAQAIEDDRGLRSIDIRKISQASNIGLIGPGFSASLGHFVEVCHGDNTCRKKTPVPELPGTPLLSHECVPQVKKAACRPMADGVS